MHAGTVLAYHRSFRCGKAKRRLKAVDILYVRTTAYQKLTRSYVHLRLPLSSVLHCMVCRGLVSQIHPEDHLRTGGYTTFLMGFTDKNTKRMKHLRIRYDVVLSAVSLENSMTTDTFETKLYGMPLIVLTSCRDMWTAFPWVAAVVPARSTAHRMCPILYAYSLLHPGLLSSSSCHRLA